ncbi:MAG: hypothetical protein ACOYWZ_22540, partial [Bacillota bacterium]
AAEPNSIFIALLDKNHTKASSAIISPKYVKPLANTNSIIAGDDMVNKEVSPVTRRPINIHP